jgi:hypothetical protein
MVVGFRNLCTPASVYLTVSMFALIIMGIQNFGNTNTYCLGTYQCDISNIYMMFIIKILYILLWTWGINLLCSYGMEWKSWFFILISILIFFIMITSMMVPSWTY